MLIQRIQKGKSVPEFTRTETRILNLLNDGLHHKRDEVFKCLDDEWASNAALQSHISKIRAKLRPLGQDIALERRNWASWYRRVIIYRDDS
jgi:DNA-binding winged helix-turn-helix (wHTH) protein